MFKVTTYVYEMLLNRLWLDFSRTLSRDGSNRQKHESEHTPESFVELCVDLYFEDQLRRQAVYNDILFPIQESFLMANRKYTVAVKSW